MPNELKNPFSATTSLSSDPSRDFDKTKSRIKSGGFTATVWTMAGMVLAACGGGTRYLEVPGEGSGIDGGKGDDYLDGFEGNDRLTGGEGSDTFVISLYHDGIDTVTDFTSGEDKLLMSVAGDVANYTDFASTGLTQRRTDDGTGTIISYRGGDVMVIEGQTTDLTLDDLTLEEVPDQKGEFILTRAANSLSEDADVSTDTVVSSVIISDGRVGTNTPVIRSVVDSNGNDVSGLFAFVEGAINDFNLVLVAGASLDYETSTSYTVTVGLDSTGDGDAPADQTFTLTIDDVDESGTGTPTPTPNTAPVAPNFVATDLTADVLSKGGNLSLSPIIAQILADGTVYDPEGDALTISIVAFPNHGQLMVLNDEGILVPVTDTVFSADPNAPVAYVYVHNGTSTSGTDELVLSYSDGEFTTQQVITFNINQPPTAADRDVDSDGAESHSFASADFDYTDADGVGTADAGIIITSAASVGALSFVTADGSTITVTGDPADQFTIKLDEIGNLSWSGSGLGPDVTEVTFTYRLSDGHVSSDEVTFTLSLPGPDLEIDLDANGEAVVTANDINESGVVGYDLALDTGLPFELLINGVVQAGDFPIFTVAQLLAGEVSLRYTGDIAALASNYTAEFGVYRTDADIVDEIPSYTINLLINTDDVADNKASFALGAATGSLSEDADTADATVLTSITVTDPDRFGTNTLTFTAVDADGNDASSLFAIQGGNLVLVAGASLDYETSTSYTVTISLTSSGDGDAPADQTFTLSIDDVDESGTGTPTPNTAPVVAFTGDDLQILDHFSTSATFGAIITSDTDNDTFTLSVSATLNGNAVSGFSAFYNGFIWLLQYNAPAGQTAAEALNLTAGTAHVITVTITGDDGQGADNSITTDEVKVVFNAPTKLDAQEGGLVAIDASMVPGLIDGSPFGTPSGTFSINAGALDVVDAGGNPVNKASVSLAMLTQGLFVQLNPDDEDGGVTSITITRTVDGVFIPVEILIDVAPVNDAPVLPDNDASGDQLVDSIADNVDGSVTEVSLGVISATDPDNDAADFTYSITAVTQGSDTLDASLFAIDSSGVVTYTGTGFDFSLGNQLTLTIQVSDGELTDSQDYTIALDETNASNTAPELRERNLSENIPAVGGTTIVTPDTSQNVGAGSNYEIHLSDDSDGRVNQESDSDAALLRVFINFGDDPDGDGDDTNNTPGDGLTGSQELTISNLPVSIDGEYGNFVLSYRYFDSDYVAGSDSNEVLTWQYYLHDYDGATHKAKVDALTADVSEVLRIAVYDSEGAFTELTKTILIDIV